MARDNGLVLLYLGKTDFSSREKKRVKGNNGEITASQRHGSGFHWSDSRSESQNCTEVRSHAYDDAAGLINWSEGTGIQVWC
jgi:uncharacterized protein (AIM24 family)